MNDQTPSCSRCFRPAVAIVHGLYGNGRPARDPCAINTSKTLDWI
jgi:hypothetical protein